jgi:DNA-binding MarR family transcriptional regulator
MSPAEWRVLATIAFHGKTTSAHIAMHATTDKVTVSRALAKLESKGWVKISSAESDRRRKHLSLTAAGRRVYNRIVPSVLEVESRLLEGVSEADLAALQRVMQQMMTNGAGLE